MTVVHRFPPNRKASNYERLVVDTPATAFATAITSPTPAATTLAPTVVLCAVELFPVRYRADGTDPTATEGVLALVGDLIVIEGKNDIASFRAIQTAAGEANLTCQFFD